MLCELVEMATQWPSEVSYVFRGALLEERLPRRSWRVCSWSQREICGPSSAMIGSTMATSTTWPRPVDCRWWRADMTANAVAREAIPSARPNGGRVGGPSGSPVDAANPLIASASVPKPGRRR